MGSTVAWTFNSSSSAIDESFSVGGETQALQFDAGPFYQLLTESSVAFEVGVDSQTLMLSGALVLTLVENDSGADYVTLGISELSATLGTGLVTLDVSDGAGAFFLDASGVAGIVTVGTASLTGAASVSVTAENLRLELVQ